MLLTIKDVLARTQIPRSTLYLLMKQGKFPRGFLVGRQSRWEERDIRAWIDKQKQEAACNT